MKFINRIPEPWLVFLSLFGAVLGWGWAWVGIREAMHYYGPGQLALGRYMVASLTLLPFWIGRGARLPEWRHWPLLIVMGLSGFTLYNFCVNLGEKTVTAGTASLLGSFLPILTTLGAWFFFREKLTFRGWSGIIIAFVGVAATSLGAQGNFQLSHGALLVLLAVFFAAIYGLLIKRMILRYRALDVTTWAIVAGTIGLIPFGSGLVQTAAHAPWNTTVNLILLGIFPGAICYALYSFALTRVNMARVASSIFFMPVTSIILGWFLLGELPSGIAFIGGVITLWGAYLVNTSKL